MLFVISTCKQNFEPTKNSYANINYTHMRGVVFWLTFSKQSECFPAQTMCSHHVNPNLYIMQCTGFSYCKNFQEKILLSKIIFIIDYIRHQTEL